MSKINDITVKIWEYAEQFKESSGCGSDYFIRVFGVALTFAHDQYLKGASTEEEKLKALHACVRAIAAVSDCLRTSAIGAGFVPFCITVNGEPCKCPKCTADARGATVNKDDMN